MARQLWIMGMGLALLLRCGHRVSVLEQVNQNFYEAQVLVLAVLGSILSLWGAIGKFSPVKVMDARKPAFESAHNRLDFHTFDGRSIAMNSYLDDIPPPPSLW